MSRFFSVFLILISVAGSLIGQEYPLLESSLSNKSYIKRICLSNMTKNPDICADCNIITKAFELNQKAGYINYLLQKNTHQQTSSIFLSGSKILRQKKLQNALDNLQNEANKLSPEFDESTQRLLSLVNLNDPDDFDNLLEYETKLLHQGLVNAATNVSVEDYDKV